jgi:hypothetical protein
MLIKNFFYNCSQEYLALINENVYSELEVIIKDLPKRKTQKELNQDFFVKLIKKGWSFDSMPTDFNEGKKVLLKENNNRVLCRTSSTIDARWHADFAKKFDNNLIQMEIQFGKIESMFKDFCGFKIAFFERRISLGIEVVLCEPNKYFFERKVTISGMANFNVARKTLPAIGLNCPIWLVGMDNE